MTAADFVVPDGIVSGASFILDTPTTITTSIWGMGTEIVWATGEPFMIVGADGVGKSTLGQQLALRRCGVLAGPLLGMHVVADDRPLLYVAADRPAQASRSLQRMVGEEHRDALRKRLIFLPRTLPVDLPEDPKWLARLAIKLGVGTVVLDSLKDVALDLAEERTGGRVARALQEVVGSGVEIVVLHHPRKAQMGFATLRTIDDIFGSRWIPAKCGSIVGLTGEPGSSRVKLVHLKQPIDVVGPLDLVHDHAAGVTTVVGGVPSASSDATEALQEAVYECVAEAGMFPSQRRLLEALRARRVTAPDAEILGSLEQLEAAGSITKRDGARRAIEYHAVPPADCGAEPSPESLAPAPPSRLLPVQLPLEAVRSSPHSIERFVVDEVIADADVELVDDRDEPLQLERISYAGAKEFIEAEGRVNLCGWPRAVVCRHVLSVQYVLNRTR